MDISFLNQTEDLNEEAQKIKQAVIEILDIVHQNRNLNFPILTSDQQEAAKFKSPKMLNNFIHKKYINLSGANYLRLMQGYLNEIKSSDSLKLYRDTLLKMVLSQLKCNKYDNNNNSRNNNKNNPEQNNNSVAQSQQLNRKYQAEIWKKAFSLFLLFHTYNQNIKGVFEIWNTLFPRDQIKRKRKQNVNHTIVIPNNSHTKDSDYGSENSEHGNEEYQQQSQEDEQQNEQRSGEQDLDGSNQSYNSSKSNNNKYKICQYIEIQQGQNNIIEKLQQQQQQSFFTFNEVNKNSDKHKESKQSLLIKKKSEPIQYFFNFSQHDHNYTIGKKKIKGNDENKQNTKIKIITQQNFLNIPPPPLILKESEQDLTSTQVALSSYDEQQSQIDLNQINDKFTN